MPGHNTEQQRTSTAGIFAIGVLVLLFYPLSLGPAEWLHQHDWLGPQDGLLVEALRVFYRPLAWCRLYEVPVICPLLNWYVACWET